MKCDVNTMKMNNFSHFRNSALHLVSIICILITCLFYFGCYSFTGGGNLPPHLKTVVIQITADNSGQGIPQFRDVLTQSLIERFRNDNTLTLVEQKGDAKLLTTITAISEATINLRQGEVESERKVNVTVKAELYDAVKKKNFISKDITNTQLFDVSGGIPAKNEAVNKALRQISEDVLLAVISGW